MGTAKTENSRRRKRVRYHVGRKFISNVLILLAAALVFHAAVRVYGNKAGQDTFYPGVMIDDIPVGGLTREEALERLESVEAKKLDRVNIRLPYEDQEWKLDRNTLAMTTDFPQLVEKGYEIGRSGNWLHRIREIHSLKNNPVYLYSKVSWSVEDLGSHLQEIAETLDVEPIDASVAFHPDAEVKFTVSEGKSGRTLDIEAVRNAIEAGLAQGKLDFAVQLPFREVPPKEYTADFAGKTEKLVTFGTDLSKSAPDRTHNVVMAASRFNGLAVQPGEVLSFNQVVGERTAEKGYRSAPMITADKSFRNAIGGGVSQTSSTLYNAAIRSGLEVTEYQRHSFPVSYLGKGLDTTVNLPTPAIDIKVKNTKDSPIYIRTFYANQKIYFEIYGEPLPNGRTIRIRTEEYETVPAPETEIRRDEQGRYVTWEDEKYVHVKSREGYKVRVYRDIMEGDKVVESELLDDHYYRPIAGITYTGVQKRRETGPTEPEANPMPGSSGSDTGSPEDGKSVDNNN